MTNEYIERFFLEERVCVYSPFARQSNSSSSDRLEVVRQIITSFNINCILLANHA